MATVCWHLDELSGSSLTLRLYQPASGSIANGADGDAMTESGDGLFSATVVESLTGWHKAYADRSSVAVATGWVNMSEASPVVNEALCPTVVDMQAAVAAALVAYNGPTKAELDAAQASIEASIGASAGEVTSISEAALQQLANNGVHFTQPLGQGNKVTIVCGMDYDHDDSRALNWTDAHSAWPVLSGATITVEVKRRDGNISRTFIGSVVTATGETKQIRLQLTAAETSTLEPGGYSYGIKATLSSGTIVDLVGPRKTWEVTTLA